MSDLAIQTVELGKRFRLGRAGGSSGMHELFERTIRGFLSQNRSDESQGDFWALRHLNIDIEHGEIVGLVGHNGAGKSVLLKILSRITWPTEGHALVAGRVGSMLEVGAGFHPEFTGRENLFLMGATLGMSKAEIRSKFDEIVDFSEVKDHLDTPVKRYSSGQYVRLAFSVAAHLDANIMLFDEVISVGDVEFRSKCMDKIVSMSREGRTVIFVSHNAQTIMDVCPRTIELQQGRVIFDGSTKDHVRDENSGD